MCSSGWGALAVSRAIVCMMSCMCANGCALSIGIAGHEKLVGGILYVRRSVDGQATIVDEQVLGLDVRLRTHDDGATIGYSKATTVFPSGCEGAAPPLGFRWPLGWAWIDTTDGVTHELGWILTRVPEPDDVSLMHHRLLGAGCMFSRRCVGAAVGYRDRLSVQAPPDRDMVYRVSYRSDKPFNSQFTESQGDH